MSGQDTTVRNLALHVGVVALLFALFWILPDYHRGIFSRVMVLAVFAMGYNILFGYTGLLSLGHAMFFSAGLYGAGLTIYHFGWAVPPAFAAGIAAGGLLALAIGVLALRTTGVAFMIVTMMFAQVLYLASLYFTEWTRGEEGLVLQQATRQIASIGLDFTNPATRYMTALSIFAVGLMLLYALARAPLGRTLVAIRENEERMRMLGYDVFRAKLAATVLSGLYCAAAGAAYAILFGYVGSSFASIHYSILPLLWVLLGGPATTIGPIVGTLLMFYLVDYSNDALARFLPDAGLSYLGVVGVALVLLVLFFPRGLMGTVRERWAPWLP